MSKKNFLQGKDSSYVLLKLVFRRGNIGNRGSSTLRLVFGYLTPLFTVISLVPSERTSINCSGPSDESQRNNMDSIRDS